MAEIHSTKKVQTDGEMAFQLYIVDKFSALLHNKCAVVHEGPVYHSNKAPLGI